MVRQVSNGPYLITTAPTLTTCRKGCGRPVLAATVHGLDRHVDTATLSHPGELAAILDGRATYHVTAADYLVRRTVLHIAADTRRPVLADHACSEIPDHHIDHAWTLAAQALLQDALGATVIPAGDQEPCPF